MADQIDILVVQANLTGRYFPGPHCVWSRAENALRQLADNLGCVLNIFPGEVADAKAAKEVMALAEVEAVDFILLVHGGFTMGDVAREIASGDLPLGVWAIPEPTHTGDVQLNNFVSLNMTMSIARGVRDLRANPIQWYYGAPEDPALQTRISTTIRALSALKSVRNSRIGLVGGLAQTFYNMAVSNDGLSARLGLEIVEYDMPALTNLMESFPGDHVAKELEKMCSAAAVKGVSEHQMQLTARCALGLRALASREGLDAFAVSDWPALQENPGMHPGSAFSWIEEVDRIPCSSEGDVLGAVTQLLARAISGRLGCLLDITEPDLTNGRLQMWHGGGGPLYMADDDGATWINHPMIGRESPDSPAIGGVADFIFRPGPHSVFRVARDATALFYMQTEVAQQNPSGFDGCRGWMEKFRIAGDSATLEDVLATVMAHGLEHHFVALPGDHSDLLAEFAAWSGMEVLARRPFRNHLNVIDFT